MPVHAFLQRTARQNVRRTVAPSQTSLLMASTSLSLISCIPAGTADGSHTEVAMFDVALMAEASPAVDVASPSFVSLTSSTALSLVLSATVPLGNDTAVEIIKALSCGAPGSAGAHG